MDKKSLAILLVASTFASSAFATTFINKLIPKHSAAIAKIHKVDNSNNNNSNSNNANNNNANNNNSNNHAYTDFSGSWMIDCSGMVMGPTVIENDVNYISMDGVEYRIGRGLQSQSDANEEEVSHEHASFEWAENGSALVMKGVDVAKANVDGAAIETDLTKFTLTMKDGQINVDGQFITLDDVGQAAQPVPMHCVLSKVGKK